MTDGLKPYLPKVAAGEALSEKEAEAAFGIMMEGTATPAQIGGLLMALRARGESVSEISGAALAMRAKMQPIEAPDGAIDVVGTGGDRSGSYNISTATAFVVAGAGVPVAKHGNRAASSRSGAADVLEALGIDLTVDFPRIEQAISKAGFGFMLAQRHHGAVRHVMPTRVELGLPTIFNFLGPLCNPARVKHALIGCFDERYLELMAQTFGRLGGEKVWIVHGKQSDGGVLDEIGISAPTKVVAFENGDTRHFTISPEDFAIQPIENPAIAGGDADTNAKALLGVLENKPGDYQQVVLLNAAAALHIAGKAKTLKEGTELARESIESGKARQVLEKYRSLTSNPSDG